MLDILRQRQGAQEVAETIGERMEVEPDLVVAETIDPRRWEFGVTHRMRHGLTAKAIIRY